MAGVFPAQTHAATGDYSRFASPEAGELGLNIYLPMLKSPTDGTLSKMHTTFYDQWRDARFFDAQLRQSSFGQAWYRTVVLPSPTSPPLIVQGVSTNGFGILSASMALYPGVNSPVRHHFGRQPGPQGLASLGGTAAIAAGGSGDSWHELTHNLGFNHGSDLTTPVTTAGTGTYNAPMRAYKGWLRENRGFIPVTTSGVYLLHDMESPQLTLPMLQAGASVALVLRASNASTELWVEYRRAFSASDAGLRERVRLIASTGSESRSVNGDGEGGVLSGSIAIGQSYVHSDGFSNNQPGTGAIIRPLRVRDTWPRVMEVEVVFPPATGAAEVQVRRDGRELAQNATDTLSASPTGVARTLAYEIENQGPGLLRLTGAPVISALVNCTVTVAQGAATPIPSGQRSRLALNITPAAAGPFSARVALATNDADENPAAWTLSGVAVAASPALALSRGVVEILPGQNDAVSGSAAGAVTSYAYTLTNRGNAPLAITSATLAGLANAQATIATAPASTVAAGASTQLVVNVTPTVLGAWQGLISLTTDDPDRTAPSWTIGGVAQPPLAPEIEVRPLGSPVNNGGTVTVTGASAAARKTVPVAIRNLGDGSLTLGTPTFGNLVNCTVSVQAGLGGVARFSEGTMQLAITPAAAGPWSARVTLTSDDTDEGTYAWTFSGTASVAVPIIEVSRPNFSVLVTPGYADQVIDAREGVGTELLYFINNLGGAPLTLRRPIRLGVTQNCTAVIGASEDPQIPARSQRAFGIKVTPTTAGTTWVCPIFIDSDDPATPSFSWVLVGPTLNAAPDAHLRRGQRNLRNGSSDAGWVTTAGAPFTLRYTFENVGRVPLQITGVPSLASLVNCTAVVENTLPGSLAAGAGTEVRLVVTPTAAGNWSLRLNIPNNDPDEAPYRLDVSGAASADARPEIEVTRGDDGFGVSNRNNDPWGVIPASPATVQAYRILNRGSAALTLARPTLGVLANCRAEFTQAPADTLAPGEETTLLLSITPIDRTLAWAAPVSLGNNDADEAPFTFTARGTVSPFVPVVGPEIVLLRDGLVVPDGATDALPGTPPNSSELVLNYDVQNLGTAAVAANLAISNVTGCRVTITTPLPAQLTAGSAARLVVSVMPTATTWSFRLALPGAAAGAGEFDWTVSGNATIVPPVVRVVAENTFAIESPLAPARFRLTRSGALDSALTVSVVVNVGGAVAGSDYVGVPSTVTFPAGESVATVSIMPLLSNRAAQVFYGSFLLQTGTGYSLPGLLAEYYSAYTLQQTAGVLGDADGDGSVTALDLDRVLRLAPFTPANLETVKANFGRP